MLSVATAFDVLLVLGRIYVNWNGLSLSHLHSMLQNDEPERYTYLFLIWNLFLAWLPYLASLQVASLAGRGAGWLRLIPWLVVWLAFFPNAPYLITDLVHLHPLNPVPYWFDLLMFFSCAFTGLMLGLISLYTVQHALLQRLSLIQVRAITLLCIGLGGFGIWLGRFQRYNSWDLVTKPWTLVRDLAETLSQRHELFHALGISALFSCLILIGYGFLHAMLSPNP